MRVDVVDVIFLPKKAEDFPVGRANIILRNIHTVQQSYNAVVSVNSRVSASEWYGQEEPPAGRRVKGNTIEFYVRIPPTVTTEEELKDLVVEELNAQLAAILQGLRQQQG